MVFLCLMVGQKVKLREQPADCFMVFAKASSEIAAFSA
jgi:hypothetical protein